MPKKIITTHWDASGQDNDELLSQTVDFISKTLNIGLDKVQDISVDRYEDGRILNISIDFNHDDNFGADLSADWTPKTRVEIYRDRLKNMVDTWEHRAEIRETSQTTNVKYEGVSTPHFNYIDYNLYYEWFSDWFIWFAREGWIKTPLTEAEKLINEDIEFSKMTVEDQIAKLIELLEVK